MKFANVFVAVLLILVVVLSSLPVEASFLCFECKNETSSGQQYCSTEQALDKNNKDRVENCTGNSRIIGCYVEVTFDTENGTVEGFHRDCATATQCKNSTLPNTCTSQSGKTTCLTCCTGNYCNNATNLKLPSPTTTTAITTATVTAAVDATVTVTGPTKNTTSAGNNVKYTYLLGITVIPLLFRN